MMVDVKDTVQNHADGVSSASSSSNPYLEHLLGKYFSHDDDDANNGVNIEGKRNKIDGNKDIKKSKPRHECDVDEACSYSSNLKPTECESCISNDKTCDTHTRSPESNSNVPLHKIETKLMQSESHPKMNTRRRHKHISPSQSANNEMEEKIKRDKMTRYIRRSRYRKKPLFPHDISGSYHTRSHSQPNSLMKRSIYSSQESPNEESVSRRPTSVWVEEARLARKKQLKRDDNAGIIRFNASNQLTTEEMSLYGIQRKERGNYRIIVNERADLEADLELTEAAKELQKNLQYAQLSEVAILAERAANSGEDKFVANVTDFSELNNVSNNITPSNRRTVEREKIVHRQHELSALPGNINVPIHKSASVDIDDKFDLKRRTNTKHDDFPNILSTPPRLRGSSHISLSTTTKRYDYRSRSDSIGDTIRASSTPFLSAKTVRDVFAVNEQKIPVEELRHISEVLPLFDEMHKNLLHHLIRKRVDKAMLLEEDTTDNDGDDDSKTRIDDSEEKKSLHSSFTSLNFLQKRPNFKLQPFSKLISNVGSPGRLSHERFQKKTVESETPTTPVKSRFSSIDSVCSPVSTIGFMKDDDNIAPLDCSSLVCGGEEGDFTRNYLSTPNRLKKNSNKKQEDESNTNSPSSNYVYILAAELHIPGEVLISSSPPRAPYSSDEELDILNSNDYESPNDLPAKSHESPWSWFNKAPENNVRQSSPLITWFAPKSNDDRFPTELVNNPSNPSSERKEIKSEQQAGTRNNLSPLSLPHIASLNKNRDNVDPGKFIGTSSFPLIEKNEDELSEVSANISTCSLNRNDIFRSFDKSGNNLHIESLSHISTNSSTSISTPKNKENQSSMVSFSSEDNIALKTNSSVPPNKALNDEAPDFDAAIISQSVSKDLSEHDCNNSKHTFVINGDSKVEKTDTIGSECSTSELDRNFISHKDLSSDKKRENKRKESYVKLSTSMEVNISITADKSFELGLDGLKNLQEESIHSTLSVSENLSKLKKNDDCAYSALSNHKTADSNIEETTVNLNVLDEKNSNETYGLVPHDPPSHISASLNDSIKYQILQEQESTQSETISRDIDSDKGKNYRSTHTGASDEEKSTSVAYNCHKCTKNKDSSLQNGCVQNNLISCHNNLLNTNDPCVQTHTKQNPKIEKRDDKEESSWDGAVPTLLVDHKSNPKENRTCVGNIFNKDSEPTSKSDHLLTNHVANGTKEETFLIHQHLVNITSGEMKNKELQIQNTENEGHFSKLPLQTNSFIQTKKTTIFNFPEKNILLPPIEEQNFSEDKNESKETFLNPEESKNNFHFENKTVILSNMESEDTISKVSSLKSQSQNDILESKNNATQAESCNCVNFLHDNNGNMGCITRDLDQSTTTFDDGLGHALNSSLSNDYKCSNKNEDPYYLCGNKMENFNKKTNETVLHYDDKDKRNGIHHRKSLSSSHLSNLRLNENSFDSSLRKRKVINPRSQTQMTNTPLDNNVVSYPTKWDFHYDSQNTDDVAFVENYLYIGIDAADDSIYPSTVDLESAPDRSRLCARCNDISMLGGCTDFSVSVLFPAHKPIHSRTKKGISKGKDFFIENAISKCAGEEVPDQLKSLFTDCAGEQFSELGEVKVDGRIFKAPALRARKGALFAQSTENESLSSNRNRSSFIGTPPEPSSRQKDNISRESLLGLSDEDD